MALLPDVLNRITQFVFFAQRYRYDHSVVFGKEQKLYKSLSDVAQTFIE
ncbi:hypothetical protein LEP1GSC103_1707 [Leptospira borgpetersenii serovar Javanica str. UI 09931]|uniref:Uncharacterized protein n=5 Tax=Leptospira borgpetersenii TaxID=174 RepID=M3F6F6_LEPBO|nr:hypothetical protein LBBP_01476 [Leptospira borgpetersenii serovar Ballum]EKP11927.1 hypothetical protein LEP1GSC128_0164 [Leptospira borgpetersenii str. 200801926]EKQ90857.1 hypothetical protein LEP1GSC101_1291 [Leptospira borgpetersenii str. UI 09149]EKR00634.1 hypothetical protein LEP1GSC121_1286 [Leptospira borgpetersenii serovar Castellonis str. 200801910]EMF97537.1 hypothetical protein LEP1GSC123_1596 [Leptospira borgpetersenii str. 200701203]EMK09680.1 hypothetical protein LEP1GSC066